MDGGDGGAGDTGDDRVMIDRVMMLRFRPIAPKPADEDQASGVDRFDNKSLLLSNMRTKRKYVRVRSRNKSSSGGRKREHSSSAKAIVTLQLLPEKADDYQKESSEAVKEADHPLHQSRSPTSSSIAIPSISFSFSSSPSPSPSPQLSDLHPWLIDSTGPYLTDLMARTRPIESWVLVESVETNVCPDILELGCTDGEKAESLRSTACPGFVSDPSNRVRWVNRAYGDMVRRGFAGGEGLPEVAVGLVVKDERGGLPRWCRAFTCRLRVQDTWREERQSQVVPCDVWRMDFGGFAWKLDVTAALSLSCSSN